MTLRYSCDAGHGINTGGKRCLKSLDPKETREWTLNSRIAEYVEEGLKEYKDVTYLRVDDRTGKIDIPLETRAKRVNSFKPNIHVSYHHDSGIKGGTGGGITVYRTPNSSSASVKYQKALSDELIKETGLKGNRSTSIPTANFYIIRNVKAPAILVEHGYMDSRVDTPIILTNKFARECAKAHINFLVKEFKLVKKNGQAKPPTSQGKVVAYKRGDKGEEVRELQGNLKELGYNISVDGSFGPAMDKVVRDFQRDNKLTVDGSFGPASQRKLEELLAKKNLVTLDVYRVRQSWANEKTQKGAFTNLDNAINEAKKHSGYKVYDRVGAIVYPKEVIEKPKPIVPEILKVPITGKSVVTSKQMSTLLLTNNPKPKIKISPEQLCKIFIEEGLKEGIRGDIAFCQAMKETGWLSYGGQVLPEQNNYCGLGATNNSPVGKGAWFKDEVEGVRAQIQHLKAYANKEPLKQANVDPRFNLVTRGIAPNWTDLNGRWAVPGKNYGQEILAIYEVLLKVEIKEEEEDIEREDAEEINKLTEELAKVMQELKDVRGKLDKIKDIVK